VSYGEDIEESIVKYANGLRESGCPLNPLYLETFVHALLPGQGKGPLLEKYKYGDSWARKSLKRHNFPVRKAAQTASKIPGGSTVSAVYSPQYAVRIANAVSKHIIPKELVLFTDETGVHLMSSIDKRSQRGAPRT
jgi:hypothetical protein